MSVRHRSTPGGRTRLRAGILLLILMCLASLAGAQAAIADPPAASITTPAQARAAGASVAAVRRREPVGDVLVVQLARSSAGPTGVLGEPERARRESLRLLDSSPDGTLAIADRIGDPQAGVTITHPDGSQAHSALTGVARAAFSPDGTWLAAVDSFGRLWRVSSSSGAAGQLDGGPYAGAVSFTRGGALLLVDLESIKSPIASGVVRFDPATRRATRIEGDPGFVFSASELADGSIAVVKHVFGAGVEVRRIAEGASRTIAVLDPRAIDASLSGDGSRIAYSVAGAIFLQDVPSGTVQHIGEGELPRLSRDGKGLLILRRGQSALLSMDGTELDRFDTVTVAWAGCAEGCRP